MLSALATFGEAHFLVYQSLNSLVSRDFLLDVLSFLLAVVSVSLVLKNSNKPINATSCFIVNFVLNVSFIVNFTLQLRSDQTTQASSYSYVFAILNMFPLEF